MRISQAGLLVLLLLLLVAGAAAFAVPAAQPPVVEQGVLDLSRWRLNRDGPVKLDGQWEFYWNQLLAPDDFKAANPAELTGYQYFPVDLALKANEMGCATVAVTSVEYSGHLTGKHPSGKRLFEACTYCLDNCTNYGDTLVDVPALGQRICPASGISASYLMWAVQSTVVEKLLEKGLKPSVYISNHMPDAARINGEALENYEKYGF